MLIKRICEAVSVQLCRNPELSPDLDLSQLRDEQLAEFRANLEYKITEACGDIDWLKAETNSLVDAVLGNLADTSATKTLGNAIETFLSRMKREEEMKEFTEMISKHIQAMLTQREFLSHHSKEDFGTTIHSKIEIILESQPVQDFLRTREIERLSDSEIELVVNEIIEVFNENNVHVEVKEKVLDLLACKSSHSLNKLSNNHADIWTKKRATMSMLYEIGDFFQEQREVLPDLDQNQGFIDTVNQKMPCDSNHIDLGEIANTFIKCATCLTNEKEIEQIVQQVNIGSFEHKKLDFEIFWALMKRIMLEISSYRSGTASTNTTNNKVSVGSESDHVKDEDSATYHIKALMRLLSGVSKSFAKKLGQQLPAKVSNGTASFAASCFVKFCAQSSSTAISYVSPLLRIPSGQISVIDTDAHQLEANENWNQLKMLSYHNTIWHAVSSSGTKEGKRSWKLVKLVTIIARALETECWWMEGGDKGVRGVFGETPLHILLLFGGASSDAQDLFMHLWDACPNLRTVQYSHRLYKGENVLHIAIIRRSGMEIINKILGSREAAELMSHRATGQFFRNEKNGCHLLGEHALAFAACTNQHDVFQSLVDMRADLGVRTELGGNNLLHLMVLNTARSSDHAGRAAGAEDGGDGIFLKMYDRIEEISRKVDARKWQEGSLYDHLRHERNAEGFTPLWLAAATGSASMFEHLFAKELETVWIYGAVTCRRLVLDGIDLPPDCDDDETAAGGNVFAAAAAAAPAVTADGTDPATQPAVGGVTVDKEGVGKARLSLLETLVRAGRQDILRASLVDRVVDAKWERYGRGIFHSRIAVAAAVAAALFVLPIVQIGGASRLLLALAYAGLAYLSLPGDVFRAGGVLNPSALLGLLSCGSTGSTGSSTGSGSVVDWEAGVARVLPVGLAALAAFVAWQGAFELLPLGTWAACASWAERVERALCAVTSAAAFARLLLLATGFERLGPFLLMIVRVARVDVPPFLAVYVVLLFAFAHLHYFASNPLHAGFAQGADSLGRVFAALLGDIHAEDSHVAADALAHPATFAVSVVNYFFVAVVLLNLLVATLSGTYERISAEARGTWRLHRAALLVSIDANLTAQERRDDPHIRFWQISTLASGKVRR